MQEIVPVRPFRFGRSLRVLAYCGLLLLPLILSSTARAEDSAATPAAQIAAHLDAGEFGRALDIASEVDDAAVRNELIEKIAAAELAAGEDGAARVLLSRFTDAQPKTQQPSLSGGGRGLMALRMLIMRVTSGPWMMTDQQGGSIMMWGMANRNPAGVFVDAEGQLAMVSQAAQTNRLRNLANQSRVATLNGKMSSPSKLRIVSLRLLEEAVAQRLENGQYVPSSMTNLAGLTRVRYVFFDKERGDILLAGPAEGWRIDSRGRAVGVESGLPVLQLDDLVTLMRTYSPGGVNAFLCSIEPRAEGIQAVRKYVAARSKHPLPAGGGARRFATALGERLGPQDVVLQGLPANSRVARVIIEADYRMKLIGVDKRQEAKLPSFFDLLAVAPKTGPVATKALRWWLTTNYEAVLHSENKTAFEFVGQSVKCLSENEFFNKQGERVSTGRSEMANQLFASEFTEGFEALAAVDTTFADLRNVFDLSLAAALIRLEGLDRRADWDRGVFARGGAYETTKYVPIKTVETVANHRVYNGTEVVVQVAGGVRGDLLSVLKDSSIYREAIRAGELASTVLATPVPEEQWWWDVSETDVP